MKLSTEFKGLRWEKRKRTGFAPTYVSIVLFFFDQKLFFFVDPGVG